jgi:hypothetical protein
MLQPGASAETDHLVKELLDRWDTLEVKYGWTFPIRISAALVANDTDFRERLATIGGQGNEIGTANLLLWPRGGEIRQRSLQAYSPYGKLGSSDTAALRSLLSDKLLPIIDIAAPDWRKRLNDALAETGTGRLITVPDSQHDLCAAAVEIVGSPVDVGDYHFYPTVEAYRVLSDSRIALDLSLRERT